MEEKRVCDICGREHPLSELKEFDGVLLCESCWNSETIVCEQCGRRIWLDDNEGDGDTPLCGQCYDRYYITCADCGRTIHQNDAYYEDEDDYTARCYSCHCRHAEHRVIHDYYYKPEPIFYGEGNRYFGVELEIDDGGEDNTNAEKIERIANSENELIYIKHDGSLSEGMEIVTYPMSLDFHLHQMPWADVLAKARNMGYRSHQSGTCGLHVHVNRTAFGETEEEQEAVIAQLEEKVQEAAADYQELSRLLAEKAEAEAQLETLMEQWEQLQEQMDRLYTIQVARTLPCLSILLV